MRPFLTSVLLAGSLLRWQADDARPAIPPGQGPVATTAVQRHGRLAVRGNTIVDQHGRPVVLRGMSLFWSQWGGPYYNADCVKWLRDDFRCTVVRAAIGVHSGGYLREPRARAPQGRDRHPGRDRCGPLRDRRLARS